MPTFTFTSPDGQKYDITGPEGATQEQAFGMLQKQLGAKTAPAAAPATPAPTTAKQRAQNFVGGLNLPNAEKDPGFRAFEQGAVPEAGGPGAALKAAGKVLPAGVTAPIKAGADWLDSALGGLKSKLAGPTAEQRAAQIIGKSASDLPTAQRDIAAAANNPKPLVKGGRSTTAGATTDEGLLGLEKTVRNMPGASERAGREIASPNNTARANVVGALAGDTDKVAALKGAREANAQKLYAKADPVRVNVDQSFRNLMERPSMVQAVSKAKQLAKEANDPLGPDDLMKSANGKTTPGTPAGKIVGANGQPLTPAGAPSKNLQVSGKGLHYMKLALDSMLDREATNSLSATDKRFLTKTRQDFLKWTEDRIPEYKQAREQFAKDSRPINRMELMQKIQAKATSNATDAAGNKIITRNGYQNAIKQYRKDLARTMTPVQLKHIDQISRDLDNAEKVNSPFIKPAGSETIRHANAQSPATMLGKLTGGHGATAALAHLVSIAPGFGWLRAVPPEQVREILVDAMLDPKAADQLLKKSTAANMSKLSDTLHGIASELGYTDGSQLARGAVAASQPGQQQ